MKSYDLRREVAVAKFQVLIDAITALDGNTDEIEAKLDAMIVLLTSLDGKDYATETTLTALEATANAMEVLLTSIDGKDFATETTLALINGQTSQFTFTGGDLNVNASVTLPAGLATEAKQDDQITLATTLNATDFSTETTLSAIKTQTDKLTFTADKLKTTGEDAGGGGAGIPTLIFATTSNLGASATYNSGVLSLVGKSQVETTVLSDTDGTINIFFYEDVAGTDLVRSLSIPYIGGSGFQYFAAPAFTNYVQYQFINSAVAQTDFLYQTKVLVTALSGQIVRLDGTIVSGMVAPITRSVLTGLDKNGVYENINATPSGNLQVTNIDAQTGSNQIVDLNGAAKFGEAIILVGDVFGNNSPNPIQWDTDVVGSGSVANDVGLLRVESGTTADSEVRFQSTKKARFMLSQFNIFHCGLKIDNIADANCERRWGSFDPISPTQNGVYFALIDGVWCVGYCKNGVETLIPQASWNGTNKDLFNESTSLSPYEIHYNAGSIFFFQRGNFIHKIGGLPDPYAAEYNLKVGVEVKNKNANTTNNGIDVYALGTYRLGEERGEPISRVFDADTLIKSSAGYVKNAYLSRTGSGGGSANLIVYDGVDNTGAIMTRVDIGADDFKGLAVDSTFSEGLYIEISGTGTINATISYE